MVGRRVLERLRRPGGRYPRPSSSGRRARSRSCTLRFDRVVAQASRRRGFVLQAEGESRFRISGAVVTLNREALLVVAEHPWRADWFVQRPRRRRLDAARVGRADPRLCVSRPGTTGHAFAASIRLRACRSLLASVFPRLEHRQSSRHGRPRAGHERRLRLRAAPPRRQRALGNPPCLLDLRQPT